MNTLAGEIIVAGLVTGTHMIEDIGIAVPHKVAVRIPADLALRSKDLWRGISQSRLFQLSGGAGLHVAKTPTDDANRVGQLEIENKRLRRELEAEKNRSAGLESLLSGLQTQLQGVQSAIGRLEALPRVVAPMMTSTVASTTPAEAIEVVGGDIPTFLPSRIHPEEAEAQIRSTTETADTANVPLALSKLRQMRSGG